MAHAPAIAALLRGSTQVWSGREITPIQARSTGFRELNALLPGHGWPLGVLIELLPMVEGIGELRLPLPALQQLCQEARDIVFVRPPHLPYPPALARAGLPLNRIIWIETSSDADARWAAEQALREGLAGAVLLWSDCHKDLSLRRLQLAARESAALTFLYRAPTTLSAPSPAALRLRLQPQANALRIEIMKAQGGRTGAVLIHTDAAA
jgi:cell division inhibitor SulA/protein ImuA